MATGNPGGITADQATITGMVNAFNECQGECSAIQSQVNAAAGTLGTNWQSDEAQPTYMRALDAWVEGFEKVRQGLNLLNGNMQSYSQLTTSTEGTGTTYAGGWAAR